jgi:acetyl esterase/lipase
MALLFGEWLDPEGRYGRKALSPIEQNYKGLAPVYMQAGAREVLCDMIRDFAATQGEYGADVLLDIWPDMPHDFQAFDTDKQSSTEALSRIRSAVTCYVDKVGSFTQGPNTAVARGALAMH